MAGAPTVAPAAPPTATPSAMPSATPSVTPSTPPTALPSDTVAAVENVKEAVSKKSNTLGSLADSLDGVALSFGHFRVSLWDVLVLGSLIAGVVAMAWFASKLARHMIRQNARFDPSQKVLGEKLAPIIIWGLAFLIGIDMLGIDLTAFTVFSGAFGLAIGFGLQKTFGNLIAGIILLMDRSIKPGDVIAVTDASGQQSFGQIRKIGIRAVSITTRDQREYLIPNENMMVNQVENWSYSSKNVRIRVPVGVGYNVDLDVAEKLMLQAAQSVKRVLNVPPPTVWLDNFGDSSVDYVILCWIKDPEAGVGNIRSAVLKKLWVLFKENGVEIPFPQRDIHLRSSTQMDRLLELLAKREDDHGKTPKV